MIIKIEFIKKLAENIKATSNEEVTIARANLILEKLKEIMEIINGGISI